MMLEACAAEINSIILGIVENQLKAALKEINEQKIFKDLKEEVYNKIDELIHQNDGSILTSQAFGEYLRYGKPIEKIFTAFWNLESGICGVDELTERLYLECITRIEEKGKRISTTEKGVIKHFFQIVVEAIYRKSRKRSTLSERITQMQIQDVNHKLQKQSATFDEIKKALETQNMLSEIEENNIFYVLYGFLCQGKISEIQELIPLFEGKSASIKIALTELANFIIRDDAYDVNMDKYIMCITNTVILETVIRFIIAYGFLWEESVRKISEKTNNLALKDISHNLCNKKWEDILLISNDQKQGPPQLSLLVAKRYPNEEWLSGRTLFWYLNKVQDRLPVTVSEQDIKEPITIYDVFLLEQEKVRLYMLLGKKHDLEREKNILLSYQKDVKFLGTQLKELYWKNLFQVCRATLDKDTILNCWPDVPSQIKMNADIQTFRFFAQILDGTVNEQELLGFCISHSDPSELVFYCSKKDDAFVIEFYEKNGRFFTDNYSFFEEYILARMRAKQTKGLKSLLEDRITDFEQWIDYWNLYYCLSEKIDFKHLWDELNAGKIKGTFYAVVKFGHYLLNHGYLTEAEQLYNKFGKNADDGLCKMLRARIMLASNRQIEALEQFKDIVTEYQSSEFVIENILYLSLLNKRPIDEQIIEFAKRIETPRLWCLLAEYYAEKNQKDQTMQAVTKALLRAKETDVEVYFTYFKLHSKFCSEKETPCKKRIEADSCVILREIGTNNEHEICIYLDNVVPHQLHAEKTYRWANASHITVEEAAENGLCFQEIGEEVTFKGKNYIVKSVKPVDYFLLSQALSKSETQNGVYKITLSKSENGELDLDAFYEEIKKHIPKEDQLLVQYRKLDQIPVPLFFIDQAKNITYGEFVCRIMQASDVIVRSFQCFPLQKTDDTQYVLSFSTEMFFILAGIGTDDFCNQTVYIPQSTIQVLEDEYAKTFQDKSRRVVASFGFEEEQLILHKEDSCVKRYFIQEALKRKNECRKLKSIQNKQSIEVPSADKIPLQNVLGICDYDAVSIAHYQGATLVAFEPTIIVMSREDIVGFQCIGIVDFLCKINLPLHKILETICLMGKYKFQYILSGGNLNYIVDQFDEIQDDEYREKCMEIWFEFLDSLNLRDDITNYRTIFAQGIQAALKECLKENGDLDKTPLIKVAMWLLFKSSNISFEYSEEVSQQIEAKDEYK